MMLLERWCVLLPLLLMACSEEPVGPVNTTRPPASAGHELVYHDSLRVVLLVNAGLGRPDDARLAGQRTRLWSWDGSRWSLIDSAGPPVRNLGGVAYDARRDKLVLYGGTFSTNLSYADTWEWDRRGGWRQLQVSGPGIRDHTQMTYDAERGVVLLFGGQSSLTSFPGDTWQWDGTRWSVVATSGPSARVHHALSFDPITRQVVLFGGVNPSGPDLGDTWIWNGTTWSANAGATRAPRTHARLAASGQASAGLLLIGGMSPQGVASDFLVWNGQTWNARTWSAARYLPGVAYDRARGVVVLFGGGASNDQLLDDTWEFDGSAWRRVAAPN